MLVLVETELQGFFFLFCFCDGTKLMLYCPLRNAANPSRNAVLIRRWHREEVAWHSEGGSVVSVNGSRCNVTLRRLSGRGRSLPLSSDTFSHSRSHMHTVRKKEKTKKRPRIKCTAESISPTCLTYKLKPGLLEKLNS